MKFLCRLDQGLNRLYEWAGYLAAGFLIALGALIMTSIISRMASIYIPGVAEFSGYSMAASSFFAMAYTFREGGHIRVALLLSRLHGKARRAAELWCLGIGSLVSGYFAFYAIKMVHVSYRFEERSEGSDAILLWIPQLGMAIGSSILALCLLHQFIRIAAGGEIPKTLAIE